MTKETLTKARELESLASRIGIKIIEITSATDVWSKNLNASDYTSDELKDDIRMLMIKELREKKAALELELANL